MSTLLDMPVLSYLPDDQAEAVAAVLAHFRTIPYMQAFLTYMPGEHDPHIMGIDGDRWFAVCVKPSHDFEHVTLSPLDMAWFRARTFGHMHELGLHRTPIRFDTAAVARTEDAYSISIRQDV